MEIMSLFAFVKNLPASASILVSVVAILVAFVLQRKKINIEEKTSISSTQQQQIQTLMNQITFLSEELEKTREQLTDLHNQNIELMTQLREANRRIGELEALLDKHKN
jgi:K+/H+ antiporter YhaU regulatory subunit KhtT